jgi:hypothetical protein
MPRKIAARIVLAIALMSLAGCVTYPPQSSDVRYAPTYSGAGALIGN